MQGDARQALQAFIDYLRGEKRAANLTQTNYQRDLQRMQAYCTEQKIPGWQQLSSNDIRQYIATRHKNGIGSKTLQRELAAIRSFYRFLLKKKTRRSQSRAGHSSPESI